MRMLHHRAIPKLNDKLLHKSNIQINLPKQPPLIPSIELPSPKEPKEKNKQAQTSPRSHENPDTEKYEEESGVPMSINYPVKYEIGSPTPSASLVIRPTNVALNPLNPVNGTAALNNTMIPSNSTCDALIANLQQSEQRICNYGLPSKDIQSQIENLALNIISTCSDPNCYNFIPLSNTQLQSACPQNYTAKISASSIQTQIKISDLLSLPNRTQSEIDSTLACYKESNQYCVIQFLRAAVTSPIDKSKICSSCTKNLMKKANSVRSVSSGGDKGQLELLSGFNETIAGNCDADFLKDVGIVRSSGCRRKASVKCRWRKGVWGVAVILLSFLAIF
ncbi:hypothetical protein HK098_003769 [Nowakowskiella sp. JEL0407]|nr:hypothetical protein HK098_003769 [Nowakowskiella sp. JEL0407]